MATSTKMIPEMIYKTRVSTKWMGSNFLTTARWTNRQRLNCHLQPIYMLFTITTHFKMIRSLYILLGWNGNPTKRWLVFVQYNMDLSNNPKVSLTIDVSTCAAVHWRSSVTNCSVNVRRQKQVSSAGTSNYIPQILWDVITCSCPWYLLLAQHSWYIFYVYIGDII